MLNNITLGQYFVGDSFFHKATPKTKIIITLIYVIILFFIGKICSHIFGLIIMLFIYKFCKIPLNMFFNNLKAISIILIFTSFINLFLMNEGNVLFKFLIFKITDRSLNLTFLVIFRLFLLIGGMSLLTYTTLPLDLARCVGDMFGPLKRFKFPSEEISTMLSISIRFVPLLVSETQKIIFAQKSRGADVEGVGFRKKVKFMVSIVIPLIVSSFKRADELAIAMESRCYRVGKKRTRYIVFKFSYFDFFLIISAFIFFVSLFLVASFSPF